MPKKSAGILLYRWSRGQLGVFLVHPGGPFWAKKDDGAWSIPKGEFEEDEDAFEAAKREFEEETGLALKGKFEPLESVRQPGGKIVYAWAIEGDADPGTVRSNTFSIEWPKGSGKMQEFPEVDRAEWFTLEQAGRKLLKGQVPFLAQIERIVSPRRRQGQPPA
jgi:predicted NUDIX family NTP pyrophosphohydrolase